MEMLEEIHFTSMEDSLIPRPFSPVFVTCSTASDKCWGKKVWVQSHIEDSMDSHRGI